MNNIKSLFFRYCAVSVMLVTVSAFAETVDLDGGTFFVTDLTATYCNTAESTATLVFDISEDASFSGFIKGNIQVVKKGVGKLTFPGDNTHTAGTIVSNGFISIDMESRIGSGTITFAGGGIEITKDMAQNSVIFDFEFSRHGTVHIPDGVTLTVVRNCFRSGYGSFTKTGGGVLALGGQFTSYTTDARWIIKEGTLSISAGNTWGGHVSAPTVTVEVHEDAILRSALHIPMPNIIMRGGILYNEMSGTKVDGGSHDWTSYSFRMPVRVLPSSNGKPSRILADRCYCGHGNMIPVFNVEENAQLRIESKLYRGYDSTGSERIGGGFIKTGDGVMTLCQSCDFDGGNVFVENGVLRLERGASLSPSTKLMVSSEARVELADGAAVDCAVSGSAKVLAEAEVWLNSSSCSAVDGQVVESVPNMGKAGGVFSKLVSGTVPKAPVWCANAINGRPALYFDNNSMLLLESYTNKTENMTMCAVVKRKTFYRWRGYVSMKDGDIQSADNSTGSFRIEDDNNGVHNFFRHGNGISEADVKIALTSVSGNDAYLDLYESTTAYRSAFQYANNGSTVIGGNEVVIPDTKGNNAFKITVVGVGGRMGGYKTAQYNGENNGSNRMFDGYVGELLVWSRILTAEEKEEVSSYLKNKWFGIGATVSWNTSVDSVVVDVPRGQGALASVEGSLDKVGDGMLALGDASKSAKVRVGEGVLALMPTSFVHKVSVWVDAADSSTIVLNDDKIVSVRNKGSCGGVFVRNMLGGEDSPGLPKLRSDINNMPTIYFDGNSALALQDSYVNANLDRRMQIYMVGRLSETADISKAGNGGYSGAFSFVSTKLDKEDYQQSVAPHIEETIEDGEPCLRYFLGSGRICEIKNASFYAKGTPFMFVGMSGMKWMAFGVEMQCETMQKSAMQNTGFSIGSAQLDLDIVQIGGRLGRNGAALWYGAGNVNNRMWFGSIGEFIVCNTHLTMEEQIALQNYLRAKWFGGNKDAEKPIALGLKLVPRFNSDTELLLAEGTGIESHADTMKIASLAVEGSATITRGSVTNPDDYALFEVSGDVLLPSEMTLQVLSNPESFPAGLIKAKMGEVGDDTEWIVYGKSGLSVKVDKEGLILSKIGLVMSIR